MGEGLSLSQVAEIDTSAVAVAVQSLERLSSATDVMPVKAMPARPPAEGQSGFVLLDIPLRRYAEAVGRAEG